MQTIILNVEGMSCQHCINSIEGALKEIGATGRVDLALKTVSVEFEDNKINLGQIKEVIEDQGYSVV